MKDIKSLYLSAKNSRRQQDIDAYKECVQSFLENAPYSYISNLEYIISSNIGLSTLKEFVDRNGISIGSYNEIMSHLAEGVKKCKWNGVNDAAYKESISMMESFKQQYQNCFIMFEAFQEKLGDQYIEAYYKNFPVLRVADKCNVNLSPMITRFGEACIPDMLIYASQFGNPDIILESLEREDPREKIIAKFSKDGDIDWEKELTLKEVSLFHNIPKDCMDDFEIFNKYITGKSFLDIASICKWIYFKHSPQRSNILTNHGSMDININPLVDDQEDALILASFGSGKYMDGFVVLNKSDGKVYEVSGNMKPQNLRSYKFKKNSSGKLELVDHPDAHFQKMDNSLVDFLKDGYFDDYNQKGYRDNIKYFNLPQELKTESALLYQWISESANDIHNVSDIALVGIRDKSLQAMVESVKSRGTTLYRESVLTCNDEAVMEYSQEEIKAMEDLLSFKEYQLTCMESADDIMRIQSEIYSLYEEFAGLVEEDVADSVIPMLPGSNQKVSNMRESNALSQKTGSIPDYLKRNHDLSYGEEDLEKKPEVKSDDEPSIDDFKRPSAPVEDNSSKITPYDYSQDDKKTDEEPMSPEDKKHVNNYYYYTYQNSNNTHTNSNSFNKQNHDDHSVGKRIHSHDYNKDHHNESVWTMDELLSQPLTELTELPVDYYNLYHEATSVLINEATAVAADAAAGADEKPGILAKIKAMMMKFINFLIEAYDKLFPKGLLEFARLEKKFKASEKLIKACHANDNILKIMEVEIPHITGIAHAVHDLIGYINTSKVPKSNIEQYQRNIKTRIMIYWGSYGSDEKGKADTDPDKMRFCVASDAVKANDDPGLRKNLRRIATGLSENTLLEAFGIRIKNHQGGLMSVKQLTTILKYTKTKINTDLELWKKREDREKMLALLKAITEVTNAVYRTMNQSYKAAVVLLKNAEEGTFESTIPMVESAPWKLNAFVDNGIYFKEEVGDADNQKPTSDDPIQDAMTDLDRKLTSAQQAAKKKVQGVVNTGKTIIKPFKRTSQWISNMVAHWKHTGDDEIKERLADPHTRSNLFKAIRTAIKYGSLMKAGLLLNPLILFLTLSKKFSNSSKESRLKAEILGEIKTELAIVDEKIKDAGIAGHNREKYQLMRFKNELNKKLIRVGGTKEMAKMV